MSTESMLGPLFAWEGECDDDEDDLFYKVVALEEKSGDLLLTLTGRATWSDRSSWWEMRAVSVREARIVVPAEVCVSLTDDHPVLLPFTARATTLYVSDAPKDPSRLLGDLWLAHKRVAGPWIDAGRFLNPGYGPLSKQASIGMGQLADGPRPLMEAYAEVAEEHGMRPSLVGDRPVRRWAGDRHVEETGPLWVLFLDESWCIAERFGCERLDRASQ